MRDDLAILQPFQQNFSHIWPLDGNYEMLCPMTSCQLGLDRTTRGVELGPAVP